MKSFFALSIVLAAASASASQLPNPLLVKTETHGTDLGPANRTKTICKLEYDGKVTVRKFKANRPVGNWDSRKAVFTGEVRNLDDVNMMIRRVARGKILEKQDGPVGGPTVEYQAVQTVGVGEPKYILLARKGTVSAVNSSEYADLLVDFLERNCD